MALKKADLAFHCDQYNAFLAEARMALQAGLYERAVATAVLSWDHIDEMMQYERRFNGTEFATVEGIELVLNYAPLLFDFESLDKLEQLLKSQRRIDKHASDDLAGKLSVARTLMWEAHRLWTFLEEVSETTQEAIGSTLGGSNAQWRDILEGLERIGVIRLANSGESMSVALSTRMDDAVSAKCPSCGAMGKGRKARLLEEMDCPRCHATVTFVLLMDGQQLGK